MSSLLTTKTLGIIRGIAGVSAIGGGLAYGSGLFGDSKQAQQEITSINNKKRLKDERFQVLNTEADSTEWGKILTAYRLAKTSTFKTDGTEDKDRTDKQLRDECQRQLNLNTDPSYKLTTQWCVKQETMSDILNKKTKVLITDTDTDNNKWQTKINSLTPSEKTTLGLADKTDVNAIKTKCKLATDKNTTDPEFNKKFEVAKRVCTVSKS